MPVVFNPTQNVRVVNTPVVKIEEQDKQIFEGNKIKSIDRFVWWEPNDDAARYSAKLFIDDINVEIRTIDRNICYTLFNDLPDSLIKLTNCRIQLFIENRNGEVIETREVILK